MSLDFLINLGGNVEGFASSASLAISGLGRAFDGLKTAAEGIAEEDPEKIFQGLSQAAEVAAVAVLKLTAAGAELGIEMSSLREMGEAAFGALGGSASAGKADYEKALRLAQELGKSQQETVDQMKRLMGAGMGADQAAKVLESVANLQAATGKGDQLQALIAKIQATGHLDARSITALAKSVNLPVEQVMAQLAQATGKSIAQIKTDLKAGTIGATAGIDAILATVDGKFGGLGAKAGQTVGGLLNALKIQFDDLFSHFDLSPLKNALSGVLKALQGPAGEKLLASLQHLFNAIFSAFGKLGGGDGPAGVISALASGIEVFASIVSAVLPVVVGAIQMVISAVGWLADHWKLIAVVTFPLWAPIVAGLAMIAAGVALLVGPFVAVIAAVSWLGDVFEGVPDAISGALSSAWDAVTGFVGDMIGAGGAMIDGLVQGIVGAASAVVSAITGVVGDAIAAAKALLGIHSPSKVFEGLGTFTSMGFAQGIANDNSSQKAINKMVAPPSAGAIAGAHASAGAHAARMGAGSSGAMPSITVNVSGVSGNNVGDEVRDGIIRAWREMRAELGAVA